RRAAADRGVVARLARILLLLVVAALPRRILVARVGERERRLARRERPLAAGAARDDVGLTAGIGGEVVRHVVTFPLIGAARHRRSLSSLRGERVGVRGEAMPHRSRNGA